jgi:ribosomal protein S18 acetylase RimI-like enzyme
VPVRQLNATDAPDLHYNCFPDQSLPEVKDYVGWCLREQAHGRLVCLVAELEGQAIASGQLALHCGNGEIGSLIVAPSQRRKGIGTALVRALIAQARQRDVRTLEISADVESPWIRAWYERLGFTYQREHVFPDERVALLTIDLRGDPMPPTPRLTLDDSRPCPQDGPRLTIDDGG